MNFLYIIVIIILIQIQTISSHREHHHNIKLRTLHKNNRNIINNNNNNNNHLQNDFELLNSSSNICGNFCLACFTLIILFYLFMTVYILRYFWKKRITTRKSREIRYGLSNELRMYPQLYNNNNRNNNDQGDWRGKKDEVTIAISL
jgi:hypothetical protein